MGIELNRRGLKKLEDMLFQIGLEIETQAKKNAPVDTGRLMNSITTEKVEGAETLRVVVGSDVEYALYVEKGTKDMEGQPFLIPAAKEIIKKL